MNVFHAVTLGILSVLAVAALALLAFWVVFDVYLLFNI